MSRLKLPVNDIERIGWKSYSCKWQASFDCNRENIHYFYFRHIYENKSISRATPYTVYTACYQIETVEDGNPNYFRINFDSIEQYPATRQPETKGLPIKDG